LALLA
jgi:hypothetical protein